MAKQGDSTHADTAILVERLRDTNPDVRCAATETVRDLGVIAATPEILSRLPNG